MNNILTPEKNMFFLKNYHKSSKLLIPLMLSSYMCNKKSYYITEKFFNSLNVVNIAYHSYVSTSCIITDYVKIKNISRLSRYSSLGLHIFATLGYCNKLCNNNKD